MAWIGALIQALGAVGAAAISSSNQPQQGGQSTTAPPAGNSKPAAQSVFGANVPNSPSAPIPSVQPQSFTPQSVGSLLAPIPDKDMGPIVDSTVGKPPVNPNPTPDWKQVLSVAPEALAAIAPLLMSQPRHKQTIALGAQGGGGGQVVPGFSLPTQGMRRPTIGELLASLPRAKYG